MKRRIAALAVLAAAFAVAQQRGRLKLADAGTEIVSTGELASSTYVRRASYGRRLEPTLDVVLHGAGQGDETSFAEYTQQMGPSAPMLTMSYVDLKDDIPAYFARLKAELARYPALILPQIGLSMNAGNAATHYEADVASGAWDVALRQLCAGLQSLDRPVYLRIGYEFNGSWNGYVAATYVAAFRHVAGAVRAGGLEHVALVWDWSAGAEVDTEVGGAPASGARARWAAFYPGDAWVDWWGINLFTAESLRARATQDFLADAAAHRFPVMIGESSPKGHTVRDGQAAVDAWFAPYFGLIRRSPGIKAFSYINWEWSKYPQWADWGDGRVQDDATVLAFYRKQVAQPWIANAADRATTMQTLHAR